MPELKTSNECIEYICGQGCVVVRDVILQLEQHKNIPGLECLAEDQKQTVLTQLKSIMSVYDATDEP
ncbi:MAG: hypothetical protein OEY11_02755 [Gammaproteobacteria bacterium]|nr:hypothetical protein [Gammaproteobacteria bacterium]